MNESNARERRAAQSGGVQAPHATHWFLDHVFVLVPTQQVAGKFLQSMADYPPSQSPGSFNLEKIQKQIEEGAKGGN